MALGKHSRLSYPAVTVLVLLLLTGGAGAWLYLQLQASLPRLDGTIKLSGLSAKVTIERDALGVPTLIAEDRLDNARALGLVHAQDRFFQMDTLRRAGAGELSELFGSATLEIDRARRLHRFRSRARQRLNSLSPADRALLDAYAAGVNAGLADLGAFPFEYLVLGLEPQAWRAEDSLLVIYAMYFDLQDEDGSYESMLGLLHDRLPTELYAFLTPLGTPWDAPLQGSALLPPPIPDADVVDVRSRAETELSLAGGWFAGTGEQSVIGSNNWAVSGNVGRDGKALLAGDMHLRIGVPNIWYRASLVFPDERSEPQRVTGVTLPGVPAIVAGSNGSLAWTFTNTYGDWSDLVILEADGEDGYRTADGPRRFERFSEIIRIRDAEAQTLEVRETIWGPVVDRDYLGRERVIRWVAHDPEGLNLVLMELETATRLEQALDIAARSGAPAQNILLAERSGRIAWTLTGPIPHRFGHDGRLPQSWADADKGWDGWLPAGQRPRIVDPESGRLWTANARTVDGIALQRMGDGGYALGARAQQIRDGLFALEQADTEAMLALQLDDRALFLEPWRRLLLTALTPEALAADPRRIELRAQVEHWSGQAAIDSVAYRMVRAFRLFTAERVFAPLVAELQWSDPRFVYGYRLQYEGPLWQMLQQRPLHLLAPQYADWDALLLDAVDAVLDDTIPNGGSLDRFTWGERNTSQFQHPFSRGVPLLGYWLDFPALPLPGDVDMPRVQRPTSGASQRMVVSPGREQQGMFHMPGGQSGHPLSPHYRDGHRAWAEGQPTPFLPGATLHRLVLQAG